MGFPYSRPPSLSRVRKNKTTHRPVAAFKDVLMENGDMDLKRKMEGSFLGLQIVKRKRKKNKLKTDNSVFVPNYHHLLLQMNTDNDNTPR